MQSNQTTQEAGIATPQATGPGDRLNPPPTRWIGWSLLAGLAVGMSFGWLLGYLAMLPFLLGLFFFLLFGLLVGATMFRVGSKSPRPSRSVLWLLGLTTGSAMLLTSLWVEYKALPGSVDRRVRRSFVEPFAPQRRAELRDGVRQHVADELRTSYPPGGFLGYLRWAATSGSLECPRIFRDSTVGYRLPQRRRVWVARVGLSAAMLQWTILVQLLGLSPKRRETTPDETETNPLEPGKTA